MGNHSADEALGIRVCDHWAQSTVDPDTVLRHRPLGGRVQRERQSQALTEGLEAQGDGGAALEQDWGNAVLVAQAKEPVRHNGLHARATGRSVSIGTTRPGGGGRQGTTQRGVRHRHGLTTEGGRGPHLE